MHDNINKETAVRRTFLVLFVLSLLPHLRNTPVKKKHFDFVEITGTK